MLSVLRTALHWKLWAEKVTLGKVINLIPPIGLGPLSRGTALSRMTKDDTWNRTFGETIGQETLGVNFTKILRAAFLYKLLKVAHKTIIKLTTRNHFTKTCSRNFVTCNFSVKQLISTQFFHFFFCIWCQKGLFGVVSTCHLYPSLYFSVLFLILLIFLFSYFFALSRQTFTGNRQNWKHQQQKKLEGSAF